MYNIKFFYKLICYLLTAICAVAYFGTKISLATPNVPSEQKIPAIFNNLSANPVIRAPSPFGTSNNSKSVPGVPGVPEMPKELKTDSFENITVIGIIPPDIAIISDNGKTKTVKTGDTVAEKMIGPVSSEGVFINDIFVNLKGKNYEK